jgi:hypothetical protein
VVSSAKKWLCHFAAILPFGQNLKTVTSNLLRKKTKRKKTKRRRRTRVKSW